MAELFALTAPVVWVDDRQDRSMGRDVVHVDVHHDVTGLASANLYLYGVGPDASAEFEDMYLDGRAVDFGRALKIAIGSGDEQRVIFEGVVSALEAVHVEGLPPLVVIAGEDALMALRMTRRSRTYENVTDADVVSAVASAHGLSAETDVDGPTYDVIQQVNQTDLAFLRERARQVNAELWAEGKVLHFASRRQRRATPVTLTRGVDLVEVNARADLAHQRTAVSVSGYDAQAREPIDEQADEAVIRAEVSRGRTGPAVLARAIGEFPSRRVSDVPLTAREARAWAEGEMVDRCRRFVTVDGVSSGSPTMEVGSQLTLERVGRPFDGSGYVVTSVDHTYDLDQGHRTRFQAERATVNDG